MAKKTMKTDYKVNTFTEMYALNAKSGQTCEVCREYFKFNGKDWIPVKS